jgi:hypothetical protein
MRVTDGAFRRGYSTNRFQERKRLVAVLWVFGQRPASRRPTAIVIVEETNLKKFLPGFSLFLSVSILGSFAASFARADTWRGTAPFCDGTCNAGERQIGSSSCGDGACCWTGHKALCANNSPTCQSQETKTSCYGVVMVCDNGFYESPTQNWHSCDTYACGACFGFSFEDKRIFSPDTCKQGFVWREAVPDDRVCVTPETRSEAAKDNSEAAGRRSPNGGASGPDTCKQGFVWREATPSDHVCVPPQVRAAAAADNSAANQRVADRVTNYGPDTCKQGFVWREAVSDDHVCVTPAARAEAANDNSEAAGRRSPNGGASGPDTCKQGFVWRDVIPSDRVCVTPEVRAATAADSAAAAERIAK